MEINKEIINKAEEFLVLIQASLTPLIWLPNINFQNCLSDILARICGCHKRVEELKDKFNICKSWNNFVTLTKSEIEALNLTIDEMEMFPFYFNSVIIFDNLLKQDLETLTIEYNTTFKYLEKIGEIKFLNSEKDDIEMLDIFKIYPR